MNFGISYAITTHNETHELRALIERVIPYMTDKDELVILDDYSDNEITLEILESLDNVYKRKLNKNYARQKNYLNSKCTKEYIFQLDADELPTETLMVNIKPILKENANIDLIWVPRTNIVNGIKTKHLQKWRWKMDSKNRINYPDYQGRIYKNKSELKWHRPVHEYIRGDSLSTKLPPNADLELIHEKAIAKQVKNNNLYSTNYNSDGTTR